MANKPVETNGVYTLNFAGYEWIVKDQGTIKIGPGPNIYSKNNVWVDSQGFLHLLLKKELDNSWTCSEIKTKNLFTDGVFEFKIKGRPDLLNENIVLGMFNYPCTIEGCQPDGTHEIDIEFARWGKTNIKENLHYNTYPTIKGEVSFSNSIFVSLNSNFSTHRFIRKGSNVSFQSFYTYKANNEQFYAKPPSDGQNVEIILNDFSHKGI
jgi:Glycosyl hydrolases family 16